jgi:hypothetical protein
VTVDYLELMGVQRWRLKSTIDVDDSTISESVIELTPKVEDLEAIPKVLPESNVQALTEEKTTVDPKEVGFSAYVSVSIRKGNQRWLWIVDQPSLSIEELRLLDNILGATKSSWENMSIADSYLNFQQIKEQLQQETFSVVLMSSLDRSELLMGENILRISSLNELMIDQDKKRKAWNDLQGLMRRP